MSTTPVSANEIPAAERAAASAAAIDLYRGIFARMGREPGDVFWVELGARAVGPDSDTYWLTQGSNASGLLMPFTAEALAECRRHRPGARLVEGAVDVRPAAARAEVVRLALAGLSEKIDLLVVDRADADAALLAAVAPSQRRPLAIRLCGTPTPKTETVWPQALERDGYRLFEHPAGGVLAVDILAIARAGSEPARTKPAAPPAAPAAAMATPIGSADVGAKPTPVPAAKPTRAVVKTFDVFDTLIARRCLDPWRVFEMVGERAGIADFVAQRQAAERRVAVGPHGLDDIYRELAAALGLSAEAAAELKALEIACELEVVVPVADNMARVRDGDLLVSDMYLPPETIRALLARAGFDRVTGLVVTSDGKHGGWIWPKLVERLAITEHLGDNAHSDVASPRDHGIPAQLTTVTRFSEIETLIADRGARDLALVAREVRLATRHEESDLRFLQMVQADLNFPLLFMSAITLARRTVEIGARRVLFSARDCNLWVDAFRAITERTGLDCEGRYFYSSRLARRLASDDYLAYVAESIGEGALIADVCGTGASLARLMEKMGRKGQETFYIQHIQPELAGVSAPDPEACVIAAVLAPQDGSFDSRYFEMCNYAGHGMVEDVLRFDGGWMPVFAADRRSPVELHAVAEQRRTFARALEAARHHGLHDVFALDDGEISALCRSLYEILVQQSRLFDVFAASHREEDAIVMDRMAGPGGRP